MSEMDILENARNSRNSKTVLLAEIIKLRSRNSDAVIFIHEGAEDVGVYQSWIERSGCGLVLHDGYFQVVSRGKPAAIQLYKDSLDEGHSEIDRVLFCFDRDFDDLMGGARVGFAYLTDGYSVENGLVDCAVLRCILSDEFSFGHDVDTVSRLVDAFSSDYEIYLDIFNDVNFQIFLARTRGVKQVVSSAAKEVISVMPGNVSAKLGVSVLSLLSRVFQDGDVRDEEREVFEALCPRARHRGKYHMWFFKEWIDALAALRRSGGNEVFTEGAKVPLNIKSQSLRYFADRAPVPFSFMECLQAFLSRLNSSS